MPRPVALERSPFDSPPRRWALHGLSVELWNDVSLLDEELAAWHDEFGVTGFPDGFSPLLGKVCPFDASAVERAISPDAKLARSTRELMDIYRDGERFWVVDDRWGMAEVDLLRGHWRSWVLPKPRLSAREVVDAAMLWPMAQLLRAKGLHLLPAASISRAGLSALVICPFNLEPELSILVQNGYRVLGQRWTALRIEEGRLAMLRLPGSVDRFAPPKLKAAGPLATPARVDLNQAKPVQFHAFCDAVVSIQPGRRLSAELRFPDPDDAMHALRSAWPIAEVHPRHKTAGLPAFLARRCVMAEAKVSRQATDLLYMLDDSRLQRPRRSRSRAVAMAA